MIALIRKLLALFGGGKSAPPPAATSSERTRYDGPRAQAAGPSSRTARERSNEPGDGRTRAALLDGRAAAAAKLQAAEAELLVEIEKRIGIGEFQLPNLPSNSSTIMSLANNPRTEISELTKMISLDPVLSGELVRTANSALYAGLEPVRSIQAGVMRIGTRALRTIVLTVSMRGIKITNKNLAAYGEYVWRQSQSVSRIAWSIGPKVGYEAETAFLLAMLHDVGKLPLLAMLDDVAHGGRSISRALIGKVFQRFHEVVGRALAERWQMGEELISVAGNHHQFQTNEEFPRSAALVSLAHKLDLHQSLRDERGFDALVRSPEMDVLDVPIDERRALLDLAIDAYGTPTDQELSEAA